MKARKRMFDEMAEHYENLADKCLEAYWKLDDQLQEELDAKFKYEQEVKNVMSESLGL